MRTPLHLRVDRRGESIVAELGYRGYRGASGRLPGSWTEDLGRALDLVQEGQSVLLIPGRDADATSAEEAVGRVLSQVLNASPDITRVFGQATGAASGNLDIMVESDLPDVPWELLATSADGRPLEASAATITRLVGTRPVAGPVGPRSAIRTWVWRPGAPDFLTDRVNAAVSRTASRLGWPDPAPLAPARLQDDATHVLILLAHGEQEAGQLVLDEQIGAGTAAHVLNPVLPRCALVVLAVCEGAGEHAEFRAGLPQRLIDAGAPAVVGSTRALNVDAVETFVDGLYGGFAAGLGVAAAVRTARTAVRELALPHPDARWHRFSLYIAGADVLGRGALAEPQWRPDFWPAPAPDASQVLADARRLAERTGVGYVGVEHLFLAFAARPPEEVGQFFRFQLRAAVPQVECFMGRFRLHTDRGADWRGTPRLRSLGEFLREGFDSAALWNTVAEQAGVVLRRIMDQVPQLASQPTGDETQEKGGVPARGAPATDLEVVGGPEDGRALHVQVGDVIGRWADGGPADIPIYQGTAVDDPALPRAAVRWGGPGQLEILSRNRSLTTTVTVGHVLTLGRVSALGGRQRDSRRTSRGL